MLSFLFLGAPRIERNNRPVDIDTRKALALAAYLALTHTVHERAELAAFLYPDANPTRARAALRRTLSALKTALGDDALEIDRETIALDVKGARVDVLEFRALAAQRESAALARAAELYRDDFLAGFTLRDSPAFDEWQFFETESLRKQFASVLERLVAHESAQRAYARAIEYARRWLTLDPLHESAHRALMLLYAQDGQRAAALRQYHECVRQLDQELGVAPLPETTELYHAIQENRLTKADRGWRTTAEQPPAHPTTRPAEYPFVGRAAELAALVRAYDAIDARGQLLVIEGEAGIGKTRLAEEFLDTVRARGARLISARGYFEQRALAYAPFVQGLRAALSEPAAAARLGALPPPIRNDAARLFPELAQVTASQEDTAGAQARFFDAVTQLLLALTGDGVPGVFFLDDVQWLDDASLDLLAFLIRRTRAHPLCMLLTWRAEELTGDHSLRRLYTEAQREGRAALVSLARLDRRDVSALVQAAARRVQPVQDTLVERLYRESEGQPFVLIEYLKWIESEGQLPAEPAPLPASVRELLHSRLARTGETSRQLLGAAAVIGRSFDFDIVHVASGRGEEETIAGLEELVAQGLIVEGTQAGAPQYDFTHEKLRALVYAETSLARRRLLHRRVAEALLERARGRAVDAMAAQIAQHYRAGGADALAAEYYRRAGDYARAVFAHRDAVEYYSAALALGFPDPGVLHEGIGDAQTLLGAYDAAVTAYETSGAFDKPMDAKLARVYLRRGEWERAARHLETALRAKQDSAARALLYTELSLAQHNLERGAAATKNAARALRLAQRARADRALAQAHNILGILARRRGDLDAARKHLEQSAALAAALNDAGAQAAALNNLALVYTAGGDDARALELTQRALDLVTREGDRHRQAALHNHLADLHHARGEEGAAMEHLKQAVSIYAEIGGAPGEWQPEIWKLEEW